MILKWSGRSSGVEWSGLKNWPGHCVVFLDKTLYFQWLSPPRGTDGYGQIIREAWWNVGGNLVMTGIASRGVMIILVASCYANRDKLRLDYPLVSSTDFNLWNGSCVLENLLNGAHNYPAQTGDKWVTKPMTVLRSVRLLWRNSISFIARSMF